MEDIKMLLIRAMKYCAYQERCQSEIEKKLNDWGAEASQIAQINKQLLAERFFDDQRFANIYVRSKFNANKWGKGKIKLMLQQKGLDSDIIYKALQGIDEQDYMLAIRQLISKKQVKALNEYQRKQKIAAWLHGKGFESDLIWKSLDLEEFD